MALLRRTPAAPPTPPAPDAPVVGEVVDVAVVGAGPAGLHAALKAALLYHTAVVFDKGRKHSRIFWAPKVDNIPGFPHGIKGSDLLKTQREHIAAYEEDQGREFVEFVEPVEVTHLARPDPQGPFVLTYKHVKTGKVEARRAKVVVLATGVVDRQPYIGKWTDRDIKAILPYANKGTVDYCLLCDGHTVQGKDIAVIGAGPGSVGIATTLRDQFQARSVTVVGCVPCALGEEHGKDARHDRITKAAQAEGVPVVLKGIKELHGLKDGRLGLTYEDGQEATFDKGFLAFGWFKMNTDPARQMGALLDKDGYVRSTEDCEALDQDEQPIPGLFVIGDIRSETWKQIPIALGDAESAVIHAFAARL
jgi:thioredoxin reductase (NADPH)